LSRRVIGVKAL